MPVKTKRSEAQLYDKPCYIKISIGRAPFDPSINSGSNPEPVEGFDCAQDGSKGGEPVEPSFRRPWQSEKTVDLLTPNDAS